jgi:L-aminopeptidase/D-esterase-like protein
VPGRYPLGARGAGCSATVGKVFRRSEQVGQGGAFRKLAGGGKIAVFTVVNAMGAIYDRNNKIVRGSLDPAQHRVWNAEPGSTRADLIEAAEQALAKMDVYEKPPMGNTTITLVVTNLRIKPQALTQLARQIHSSMARAIQPFHCPEDGDQLYMVSTDELDCDPRLGMGVLGTVAGEVAWDAVLSCYD